MDRGMFRCAAASVMFVVSFGCETTEAADPGFYVGASAGRSEQSLDEQAGVGKIPVVSLDPPAFGTPIGTPFNPLLPFPLPPDFFDGFPIAIPLLGPELSADEVDVGWNFAVGYRVNEYFAAELAYVDAGEASLTEQYRTPASAPFSSEVNFSYRVRSRGPAVSLLGSLPLSERWEVFLRGGVLFAEQEVEYRSNIMADLNSGPVRIDRDYSDEVVTVGAGVQWAFLPRWTARLEYQRTDDLKANDIMGESRLDQASLSVLFGL